MSYDTHYQCDAPNCKSNTTELSKFGSGWVAWSKTGHSPYRSENFHSCSAKCARALAAKLGADAELLAQEEAALRPDLAAQVADLERRLLQAQADARAAASNSVKAITHQDVREAAHEVFREVKSLFDHLTEQAHQQGRPAPRGLLSSAVDMAGNAIKRKVGF